MSVLPSLDGVFGDSADAVSIDGVATSWEGLAGRADALVARFDGAGTVALSGAPTLDTVIAVVAGLRSGTVVVPVPADAGPMERDHILRDSGAALVIGHPDWPEVGLPRVAVPTDGVPTGWADVDENDRRC